MQSPKWVWIPACALGLGVHLTLGLMGKGGCLASYGSAEQNEQYGRIAPSPSQQTLSRGPPSHDPFRTGLEGCDNSKSHQDRGKLARPFEGGARAMAPRKRANGNGHSSG